MTAGSQAQGLQGWGEGGSPCQRPPPLGHKSRMGPQGLLGKPQEGQTWGEHGVCAKPCNAPRVGLDVARRVRGHRATGRGPRPQSWAKAKGSTGLDRQSGGRTAGPRSRCLINLLGGPRWPSPFCWPHPTAHRKTGPLPGPHPVVHVLATSLSLHQVPHPGIPAGS